MEFLLFDTPLGSMALGEEEGAIIRLWLPGQPTPRLMSRETPLLGRGRQELLEYLSGERRDFDLPLQPKGTPFQLRVWNALRDIPYGQTRTYAQIAQAVESPRGFRAVGMANHHNPIPILIPCHRVVGADGSLTGYAGGVERKQRLLTHEGVDVSRFLVPKRVSTL